jgi:hypothetical protein
MLRALAKTMGDCVKGISKNTVRLYSGHQQKHCEIVLRASAKTL